ncbi:MAG TPA: NADH-quinone oxidoreductase subunit M [Nitrospirota bacterium]|nr:NADH-quinone oxidoreductase subunit M [Nitrospirota bacterium]
MILAWLIIIPLLGGLAAWPLARKNAASARWASLAALVFDAGLLISLWSDPSSHDALGRGTWLIELNSPWIPQLGISIHLAMDGLSLVLVALTLFLGIISVACSWTEIRERTGFFHLNLMAILAGILGVFLSLDLFLFYFFWELMLVPMYFLISIWGHENRAYASLKFFLFTQAGGLLMLLSILGLYFIHGRSTGVYTFDYSLLLGTSMAPKAAFWLMLGFFISFTVKLPMVPFHPWLPDAHTEAPTAGSVILAGLLLKTGAYGLLRFVLPLFREAAMSIAPTVMIIAVVGIIYGAVLAFAQTDLKRLVAYTSVSHMGFVLLGIFAWNMTAMQGAIMQMLAHGVSTGALFVIAGMLQERIHTRDMDRMGGFWSTLPRLSGVALVFALASLGLPGFGNFVAEFMVLLGAYRVNILVTAFAAAGLVFAAIYSLWMIQRVFHGEPREIWEIPDLSALETGIMAVLIIAIFWLGLYPRTALNITAPVLSTLQNRALQAAAVSKPLQQPVEIQKGSK